MWPPFCTLLTAHLEILTAYKLRFHAVTCH